MKKLVAVSVMTWMCHMASASAGVPDWCKDASMNDRYDLKDLSSKDVGDVIETFAAASCKPNAEAEAAKADIEKARQAWGKKLGMNEADWADAVAYANVDGRPEDPDLSTKDLASFTPIDQYVAIKEGFASNGNRFSNPVYLTDMLEPNLTEVGRFGYISRCINTAHRADESSAVPFAICQGDIDAFDTARFAAQLRTDTAHKPEQKMKLRLQVYALPAKLKEHAETLANIYKKDEAYKKLWDAAKKGRADWTALFSGNKDLLSLAQKMDTYHFTKSRKAFDGCAETTTAALQATITAKVPAKLFKDQKDIRRELYVGVSAGVGPPMLDIPEIAFIAGPYIICHNDTGTAEFLSYWIDKVPGQRGPRGGAFTEITKAKIVLDDMNASIDYSTSWVHPFARSHGSLASAGAVIKSIKVDGEMLVVESEILPVKVNRCVETHRTNRISRINSDGTIDYELICDKMGVVTYNDAWGDFKISKSYQKLLKKGMLFSSVNGNQEKGGDILALWPKKDAALPTHVFGAPVK